MNFFEHQNDARTNTKKLIALFVAAVLVLLVITNLAVAAVIWSIDTGGLFGQKVFLKSLDDLQSNPEMLNSYISDFSPERSIPELLNSFISYLNPERAMMISAGVIGTILLVILFKRLGLSGGGKSVAESLGGTKISQDTDNFDERKTLNIVQEMALASGLPVPPVYVMEEQGINAFAAGFNVNDAVIGVSRGCIEQLNRDQLQGVVAHEFSHILNGDMRLNLNLVSVLAGILFIGHTGWFLVRGHSPGRYYLSSSRRSGAVGFLMLGGFVLIVIGFIGAFFGNLIKSAVSRQREFLADASAVQFTRNPDGISGALKMIGGATYGSEMRAAKAEEMSHLFFGNALSSKVLNIFATHPPLEERISRIDPKWNGRFLTADTQNNPSQKSEATMGFASGGSPEITAAVNASGANAPGAANSAASLGASIGTVGQPSQGSYQQAKAFLGSLDPKIKTALTTPDSARALVYLLLMNDDTATKKKQWDYIRSRESRAVAEEMVSLQDSIVEKNRYRLDILEMAVPALKEMTKEEYSAFLKHLVFFVKADNKIDLFEWLLYSLLLHYLKPNFEKVKPVQAKYKQLTSLENDCRILMSHLTHCGSDANTNGEGLNQVFDKGFNALGLGGSSLLPESDLSLKDLSSAIGRFSRLYPLIKPRFLKACAECIQADNVVTQEEYELLRAISALIDCPMPGMEINEITG